LIKLYEKITDALVKDGYVIIGDAFNTDLPQKLLKFAQNEKDFKKAGISNANNLHIDNQKRRDKIYWLDEDYDIQSEFLSFTKGLKKYLNKELYLGLSYYESHFAIYKEGDFYEKHLDAFKQDKNRVVTTVFYLNNNWQKDDGGELIIYNKDDKKLAEVAPEANTLVVFMSEKFPHEVLKAKRKRYSIAGWFRVDK